MSVHFDKFQGAGNDFVMLDNRNGEFSSITTQRIAALCDRRFGIGADGLLLLSVAEAPYAFRMEYFNQDGSRATFCGNGARCICAYAVKLGLVRLGEKFAFVADDGNHEATASEGWVDLLMRSVSSVEKQADDAVVLDTGVPHYVKCVADVSAIDIMATAPSIRYSDLYAPAGVNVNFVQIVDDSHIKVRTYERGVEGETLACGTGITASAIAASLTTGKTKFDVQALGGNLTVSFCPDGDGRFGDVYLGGPALHVFSGDVFI